MSFWSNFSLSRIIISLTFCKNYSLSIILTGLLIVESTVIVVTCTECSASGVFTSSGTIDVVKRSDTLLLISWLGSWRSKFCLTYLVLIWFLLLEMIYVFDSIFPLPPRCMFTFFIYYFLFLEFWKWVTMYYLPFLNFRKQVKKHETE